MKELFHSVIYSLQDLNGRVRYIGQTRDLIEKRYRDHISDSKRRNNKKCTWIRKCIKLGYNPLCKIIDEFDGDFVDIDLKEIYWIDRFKKEGAKLTNQHSGGLNHKMSEESKLKISKSKTGKKRKPFSKEWIEKIKISNLGRKITQEHKDKISKSNAIRCCSLKTRLKMSKSQKERFKKGEYYVPNLQI